MRQPPPALDAQWPEAMATVTACRYEFGAGRALAFGAPSSKHFLISFNYWANGLLHTGRFRANDYLPQGHLFPIRYHPVRPHENTHSIVIPKKRAPWIALGIVGFVVVSVATVIMLRGCMGW